MRNQREVMIDTSEIQKILISYKYIYIYANKQGYLEETYSFRNIQSLKTKL